MDIKLEAVSMGDNLLDAVPKGQKVLAMYSKVIVAVDSLDLKHLSLTLRKESARLEATIGLLSISGSDGSIAPPKLYHQALICLREMDEILEGMDQILLYVKEKSAMRKIKHDFRDQKFEAMIARLSSLNNRLMDAISVWVNVRTHEQILSIQASSESTAKILETISSKVKKISDETADGSKQPTPSHLDDVSEVSSWSGLNHPEEAHTNSQILRDLVIFCDSILTQVTEENTAFSEVLGQFKNWKAGMELEYLYQTLDYFARRPSAAGETQHVVTNLIFRSVIRIVRVLSELSLLKMSRLRTGAVNNSCKTVWWSKARQKVETTKWRRLVQNCNDCIDQAYEMIPDLPDAGIADFTDVERNAAESTGAVLQTVKLVVQTLQHSVPSTTRMARDYSVRSEDMLASDVTKLLDICVDLVSPATKALSRASQKAAVRTSQSNTTTVDYVHIQQVLKDRAQQLQTWKEQHREDIESKLANKPHKLASVAEAIKGIATILSKWQTCSEGDIEPAWLIET
jgi:hypothetical protein